MVTFSVRKEDGQRSLFTPFIYVSVCLFAELSVSLVVTVVPILSCFSQVTYILLSTYVCPNSTMIFFFFLTFHLSSFFIIHKHVTKFHLLRRHCLLLTFKLFTCTLYTCLRSCVKLLQSLLSHSVSFCHFLILFCRAIRCCKVPPCSSYSKCRCSHRAHPSR